jgi:hypothetical protein
MNAASLALVTDAWHPQGNGVVNTLQHTRDELHRNGYRVSMLTPECHNTWPCPSYPEIRLALFPERWVSRQLDAVMPDHIHIATEGPIGSAACRYCLKNGWRLPRPTYPVPGIHTQARPRALAGLLCLHAEFSGGGPAYHGVNLKSAAAAGAVAFQKYRRAGHAA